MSKFTMGSSLFFWRKNALLTSANEIGAIGITLISEAYR